MSALCHRLRYGIPVLGVFCLFTALRIDAHRMPGLPQRASAAAPVAGMPVTRTPVAGTAEIDPSARSAGADESWWQGVSATLERGEYEATLAGDGLQAPNRAHNLRTRFRPEGIAVGPRLGATAGATATSASAWQFGWETAALGRSGHMEEAAPAVLESHGSRVIYARAGWSEWYENTPEGLEQGFTIENRPPGPGPLRVAGTLTPGLTSELRDGEVDFFDAGGAHVLHYGKLATYDARGRDVPSRLALEASMLIIEVDDRAAVYPITIDPLMTSPAWTGEPNQELARYAASLATAGDVNGDGFSDVIVGAETYDNGELNEGRAFLYLGSAAGIAATPAWSAESNTIGAELGFSVASAGDVNGDGFSDVIIGARNYNDVGRAYLYPGSAAGLSAIPSWTVDGTSIFGNFAFRVATAGDVNRDGYSDVLIGAPLSSASGGEGEAHLYLGSATGLGAVPAWTASPIDNGDSYAQFGVSVSTAGDVNGDGFPDVIVGANGASNGERNEGRAYVYYGSATGLASTPAWTVESNQAESSFGNSVATAGDVNGDGYADVIIGALGYDNGSPREGKAFVYHGGAAGISTTPSWTAESNQDNASFGYSVATAGDVNGDGYSDVIIGCCLFDNGETNEGRALLYKGSAVGLAGAPAWITESNQVGAVYGFAVGTAGDVNGDGYSDVLVGAHLYDNGENDEGRAFAYYGGSEGLSSNPIYWTTGGQGLGFWGWSVGSAGDVNGDGYSDIFAVASSFDNGQADEGKVWVYHGSPAGVSTSPAWSGETNQVSAQIASAASAGDVNGDGYTDFIFGSYGFDGGQNDEGRTWLHLGSSAGLNAAAAWTSEPDQASAWFGVSVGCAGDVNGDGYADVLVGADGWDNGQSSEGRAWLYLGSSGGLGGPTWSIEGNQDGASLGYSVATAGDVNRDGFSDVLIALPTYDNGQVDEGVVWVFHGSSAGLGASPSRVLESNQTGASFGSAVAPAGDVNGDGYSDAIIGAPSYDGGQTDEGRASVFQGGIGGLAPAPAWTTEPDQAGAQLGRSVATAGDVNGDGFSDVLVGAPYYDDGEIDEGRVWTYHGSPTGLGVAVLTTQGDQQGALYGYAIGTAGDVNGDGFSEAMEGAPGYTFTVVDGGAVWVFPGNKGLGLDRVRQQMKTDLSAPIDINGRSDSQTEVLLHALARTAAGRGRVRLEVEMKPVYLPLDGTDIVRSPWGLTGFPAVGGSAISVLHEVGGLLPGTVYHWRVRIASDSPFFPRSPWLWHAGNAVTEGDVRTGGNPIGIAEGGAGPAPSAKGLILGAATPNPFSSQTSFDYLVPGRGRVRLAVYDLTGRLVAELVDENRERGKHGAVWNGRNASGEDVPSGIYFLRLEHAGGVAARKVVVRR